MWIWPVWYIGGDCSFKHCISLDEDQHSHLIDHSRVNGHRPTALLREKLDSLVGIGRLAFQNRSTNSDQHEMLTLWFTSKEDQIMVNLWLPFDDDPEAQV